MKFLSQIINMFRAIGLVIVLWYVSSLFTSTFSAMDQALSATFHMVEVAAIQSEKELVK